MIVPPFIEKKRLLLGGELLLTVGAAVWLGLADDKTGDVVDIVKAAKPQAIAKHNANVHRAGPVLSLPVLAQSQEQDLKDASGKEAGDRQAQAADIFKSHAWYVPPPLSKPSRLEQAEAAPPAPPPLPFTFLGIVEDDGHTVVFLAKEQRLYTVRKGEVFDGQYRLEDESSGRIEFVYLPLNVKQTLVIKGAS